MPDFASMSLLYPDEPEPYKANNSNLYNDLNLARLVRSLALHPQYETYVAGILLNFTSDVDVIQYRQAILNDLLNNPDLVEKLHILLEEIIALEGYLTAPQWKENVLRQVAWRLSELQRYVDTVTSLYDVLISAGNSIQSEGFQKLRSQLKNSINGETFQHLKAELPELLPKIRGIRSITIGINLDLDMRPLSATLLDTHNDPFVNETMMSRLLGVGKKEGIESDNPLHNSRFVSGLKDYQVELNDRNSPVMPQLFRDLSELMDDTSRPVVRALKKYTQVNSQVLVALKMDIAFYLGVVKAIETVRRAGLAMTQPDIVPMSTRKLSIKDMYNINLFFQQLNKTKDKTEIVGNDVEFGDDGRIFILTGPNQGGKTTYTTAIGLVQILGQAGLHVPATYAEISPVDAIYTHFATEERPNLEAGRLGEEARRLNDIFKQATRHSLVLLNESLASTSATESLFLARDVIRAFRLLGVRGIFATHLHDLASACDEMNAETEGDSKIISVVSQVQVIENGQGIRRTYTITPAPPNSTSYAIELAGRFGISFEQLKQTIKRGD
ncbi:MAG: DNA mismatch repair protein MutS [Phototrophicaceae bacterium]